MNEKQPFLNFRDYKKWSDGVNSTGKQPSFSAESDERCKRYLIGAVDGDDILRKVLVMNLVTTGAVDRNLAELYIMKKIVNGGLV